MDANTVDLGYIESRALDGKRKEQLIKQLKKIKDPKFSFLFKSEKPLVVEINCSAIPVPTRWYSKDKLFFHKPPLLLRPDITTNDKEKRSLYSYILEFADAELSSADGSEGIGLAMPDDHGYDSDEDSLDTVAPGSGMGSVFSALSLSQQQQQQQNTRSVNKLTRYMVLRGCLGNGKSHIMCELALRAIVGRPDLRVAYPLDCHQWSQEETVTAILIYLVDALHIAFVKDDFLNQKLKELDTVSVYDLEGATAHLLEMISPKDPRTGVSYDKFRLVLFVDNYNEASDNVKLIVDELMKQEWIFIVFAARSNRPIDLKENNFVINSNYTREEAKAIIDWIINEPEDRFSFLLDLAVTSRNILNDAKIDEICSLVSEFTWLNPREITELFDRNQSSGSLKKFLKKANDFVNCHGDEKLDKYLAEVTEADLDRLRRESNIMLQRIVDCYISMYFGIKVNDTNAENKMRGATDPDNNAASISPFIQYNDSNMLGDCSESKLSTFSCPRVAHYMLRATSSLGLQHAKCYTDINTKRLGSGKDGINSKKTHYSKGFVISACSLGAAIYSYKQKSSERSSKLVKLQGTKYNKWGDLTREISLHTSTNIEAKVFFASASKDQDGNDTFSPMSNIDFIIYYHGANKYTFCIVGFEFSSCTWSSITSNIRADSLYHISNTDPNACYVDVVRICTGVNQALIYRRDIDESYKCHVEVLASPKTFGNTSNYNRNIRHSSGMEIKLVCLDLKSKAR